MNKLINKFLNRETIVYTIFGVLTTVVDFAAFGILYYSLNIGELVSNTLAWVLAVIFAFITNKLFVFQSKTHGTKELFKEIVSFVGCRLVTAVVEVVMMMVTVGFWKWNSILMKIITNIVVMILNFIFSKIIIFKKGNKKDEEKNA